MRSAAASKPSLTPPSGLSSRRLLPQHGNELVSLGVDWITGTAAEGFTEAEWDALCGDLLTGEHQDGNIARPMRLQNYDGIKCGPVFCGLRHDGAMVQVEGEMAQLHWKRVFDFCSRIPRIDLQATIRIPSDVYLYVRRQDQLMRRAKKRRGRGPKIHFDRGENGGATAYVGRKSSRRYGRIYNKAAESGLDHYTGCVRAEAVFREDLGRRIATFVRRCPSNATGIWSVVSDYFLEVGARLPPLSEDLTLLSLPVGIWGQEMSSDVHRKLKWLQQQVRPTIELLRSLGHDEEVFRSLGLSKPDLS